MSSCSVEHVCTFLTPHVHWNSLSVSARTEAVKEIECLLSLEWQAPFRLAMQAHLLAFVECLMECLTKNFVHFRFAYKILVIVVMISWLRCLNVSLLLWFHLNVSLNVSLNFNLCWHCWGDVIICNLSLIFSSLHRIAMLHCHCRGGSFKKKIINKCLSYLPWLHKLVQKYIVQKCCQFLNFFEQFSFILD